jgi:hypothetical protein
VERGGVRQEAPADGRQVSAFIACRTGAAKTIAAFLSDQ